MLLVSLNVMYYRYPAKFMELKTSAPQTVLHQCRICGCVVGGVSCAYLWCSPLDWNQSSMGNIVLTVLKISGHSKVCNLYTHAKQRMNNQLHSLHNYTRKFECLSDLLWHMTTTLTNTNSSSYIAKALATLIIILHLFIQQHQIHIIRINMWSISRFSHLFFLKTSCC